MSDAPFSTRTNNYSDWPTSSRVEVVKSRELGLLYSNYIMRPVSYTRNKSLMNSERLVCTHRTKNFTLVTGRCSNYPTKTTIKFVCEYKGLSYTITIDSKKTRFVYKSGKFELEETQNGSVYKLYYWIGRRVEFRWKISLFFQVLDFIATGTDNSPIVSGPFCNVQSALPTDNWEESCAGYTNITIVPARKEFRLQARFIHQTESCEMTTLKYVNRVIRNNVKFTCTYKGLSYIICITNHKIVYYYVVGRKIIIKETQRGGDYKIASGKHKFYWRISLFFQVLDFLA